MAAGRRMLCLPCSTGDIAVDGVVVCEMAGMLTKSVELAGEAYQALWRRRYGRGGSRREGWRAKGDQKEGNGRARGEEDVEEDDDDDEGDDEGDEGDDVDQGDGTPGRAGNDSVRQFEKLSAKRTDDYYELLGLGSLRWRATEDDIRKAFRKMSLVYHPDKIAQTSKSLEEVEEDDVEERFKMIKKAYDILSDRKKRASYDSVDDFDDSIPSEKAMAGREPDEFYRIFGSCFELNARWSTSNRVPKLGTETTSWEEVMSFYDFWFSFKSWREFSLDIEFDPDQAESREEKRWIERQNAKKAKARRLEEAARIRFLVETAYKLDPRVLRKKEEDRTAKEEVKRRKQEEKEAEEARKEAERVRQEQEEEDKARIEKERRAAEKKEKEKMKKVFQKAKKRVRQCVEGQELKYLEAAEYICGSLSFTEVESIVHQIDSLDADASDSMRANLVLDLCSKHKSGEVVDEGGGLARTAPSSTTPPQASERESDAAVHAWSIDELSLLSKAVGKFPGGTRNRWDRVAEAVQTRSANECLRKANELRNSTQKDSGAQFDAFQRFIEKKKTDAISRGDPPPPAASDVTQPEQQTEGSLVSPMKSSAGTTPLSNPDGPPNNFNFTKKQQASLEDAMKKIPSSAGPDRWKKISALVAGKTPADCESRFKELVQYYKSKRTTSSSS
uniref:DnaJ homolog subfamily C member 2 n=1 Tax=Compsopogon caeruleus TaxID=31354 RepID=A0A7S1XFF0_9RHOD|mmetsp:Transcript_3939/g.7588  ORF Transcript_3939/g.7588 Transcript_3939/m.7588 type:complete len:673 (+) Transcript_3939:103-2121(+)